MKELFAAGILVISILTICFGLRQNDFMILMPLYAMAFVAYIFILTRTRQDATVRKVLLVAIGLRIVLVFSFPNLSDDIYRFLWDGHCTLNGISPLSYLPSEIMSDPQLRDPYFAELYQFLNSPDYYTVYPPVSQAVFIMGTLNDAWSMESSVLVIKSTLLVFELGLIWLLFHFIRKFGFPLYIILFYALNPLVIIEIMGNMHFEGVMVFFICLTYYFIHKNRTIVAGLFYAFAVGTKLLPLILGPSLIWFLMKRKMRWLPFLMLSVATTSILFLPFFLAFDVWHFLDSVNLYFRKFEFNASIYYVLRAFGQWLTGYNQIAVIGPVLAVITFIIIIYKSFRMGVATVRELLALNLEIFIIYLLLATTVHPWYLIVPIFLGGFLGNRVVLAWSLLIYLSYHTYMTPLFREDFRIVFAEYALLGLFWWIGQKKIPGLQMHTGDIS